MVAISGSLGQGGVGTATTPALAWQHSVTVIAMVDVVVQPTLFVTVTA